MRWEELVVSWNCQSWSRILCIGNVYQRVVEVLALISLKWFTALASAEQLKASTFQKIETTMILLDNFDTVAGAHWCKVWTLVHPMGWHLTQPALLVYQPFSQIADTSSAYRCMTLCFLLLSGAVALICDFILDVIQDVIASSVVWHFVVSKKRDQTLWSSKHIFCSMIANMRLLSIWFCCPTSKKVLKLYLTRCTKSQERALSRSCKGLNPVMSRVIVSATNRGSRRLIPDAPMRHHSLVQLPLSTPKALRASLPLEE